MVDDTSRKLATAIQSLQHDVKRLLSGRPLENSSVRNGMLRFIGGVLRLDSGARFELIGSALISGVLRVIGRIDIEGLGILTVNGLIDLLGNMRVRAGGTVNVEAGGAIVVGNVRIENGMITVGTGAGQIVIDGATGAITTGNVKIQNGKITVGTGSAQIVIDGATGKITAGNMTLDPTVSGGAVVFANGAQVFTDASTIQVFKGNSVMQVSNAYARIQYGGSVIEISADGIRVTGAATKSVATVPGGFVGAFIYEAGYMKRLV